MTLWIDIINPPNVHFFNSIKNGLNQNYFFTIRTKSETVDLCKYYGLEGEYIGRDYRNKYAKTLGIALRSLELYLKVKFDYAIGFENPMTVFVAKMKRKKSILICDNDLKLTQKNANIQDLETKVKSMTDFLVTPKSCFTNFSKIISEDKIHAFDGFKEDIYLAEYQPDPSFLNKIPFCDYVVVRPEALFTSYISYKTTIAKDIVNILTRANFNVVYLPRDNVEKKYIKDSENIYVPNAPLNGIDLCYYSRAVLTGSGTMAREAALLGKPAVSFFPSEKLLSVDKQLIKEQRMLHSRDPEEIVKCIIDGGLMPRRSDSRDAKSNFIKILNELING